MRVRSSSSVSAIRDLVSSASCSSCALVVIVLPHLALGRRSVFPELMDGSVGNEIVCLESVHAYEPKDEPDQKRAASNHEGRPVRREACALKASDHGLEQDNKGRDQQHGAAHDEPETK